MYRVPPDRAWWPAVGAPLERGVRPLSADVPTCGAYTPQYMKRITLYLGRARRYFRLWVWDGLTQTAAPLWDTNARLNLIGVFVAVLWLGPRRGAEGEIAAAAQALQALETLLWSIPVFLVLNMFFALFRVVKREREDGSWFGPRFVYHRPRHLTTALVDERDNGRPISFQIEDAEDASLISYAIETDRTDERVKVELAWPGGQRPMDFGVPMNVPKGAFRLPKVRTMTLLCHVAPNSTATTVRVFMTGWELGKGDGRG